MQTQRGTTVGTRRRKQRLAARAACGEDGLARWPHASALRRRPTTCALQLPSLGEPIDAHQHWRVHVVGHSRSPLAPQPGASRRRASGAKAEARRHGKRTASARARAHAHFGGHTATPISNPSLVKRRALLQSCSKSLTWGELPNLELSLPPKAQTTLPSPRRKTHTTYPPNTAQPVPTPHYTRYCTPHQNPCSSQVFFAKMSTAFTYFHT